MYNNDDDLKDNGTYGTHNDISEQDSQKNIEQVFNRNMCDHTRNNRFIKIVHDINMKLVFGITDDLVIRVDNVKKQSSAIPLNNNETCKLPIMINLLPTADPTKCKHVYKMLNDMLIDIVTTQRALSSNGDNANR